MPVTAGSAARASLCMGKGACAVLEDNMSAFLAPSNCRSLIIVESEVSPYCRGYIVAVDLAYRAKRTAKRLRNCIVAYLVVANVVA